ncbi:MAG: Synechococcus phage [Bacteroidota bacterium]|jgi:D-beta-D-heptose 7-phosphate kinase/D-beta-D-heptose 1-phosphate adenosyltransferase
MRVWVNGTFDVLHLGHIRLLKYAASLGELRVGIDTDERIKLLKGETRPFNNLGERIEFLSALKFVKDIVTYTTDSELENHIKNYKPDIMVKGSDWKGGNIIGGKFVKDIVYIDMVEGKSTSKILSYENNRNR